MKLPAYPRYKPSGVEWLGDVPEHWDVKRLSYLATLKSGENITSEMIAEGGDYPVYGGNGLRGNYHKFTHHGHHALIGRQGALCGNINYASGKFWASEHALVVSPLTEFVVVWMGELLRAMNLGQYSITAAQPGIAAEMIRGLRIPVPPLPEQQAVAAFLDRETGRIDRLVAKKRELIERLKEKRTALISRTVTRGLNPDAAFKPSGLDWLGEIPKHWGTPPLYTRYSIELGKMLDASRIVGHALVHYLRNIDVQWDRINFDDLPEMDIEERERGRFTLKEGDLLVCEGGEVGRSAIFKGRAEVTGFQKALHRMRPLNLREHPRFMFYTLTWASSQGIFFAEGNPNTIPHLTGEKLRRYRFPQPPLPEQAAIATYLDAETAKLDALAAKVEEAIERLQEYRTALITAAVTGKIDVRSSVDVRSCK